MDRTEKTAYEAVNTLNMVQHKVSLLRHIAYYERDDYETKLACDEIIKIIQDFRDNAEPDSLTFICDECQHEAPVSERRINASNYQYCSDCAKDYNARLADANLK